MRKLRLESLQVESFITTEGPHQTRGTVQANAAVPGTTIQPGTGQSDCYACVPLSNDQRCVPATYNAYLCGETQYFDCTFGCTVNCSDPRLSCGPVCYAPIERTAGCTIIGEPVEGP